MFLFFRKRGEFFYFDDCDTPTVEVKNDVFEGGCPPTSDKDKCHCFSVKKERDKLFLKEKKCGRRLQFICELSMFKKSISLCLSKLHIS